jgi:hypothetical protein
MQEIILGLNLTFMIVTMLFFYMTKRAHDTHWDEIVNYIDRYIQNVLKQEKK